MTLIECVPNFSEGRRPEVVDEIVAAVAGTPGVTLLDRQSDAHHNRSVVTFVGESPAAQEAAFRAIATAARLIDLNRHEGAHPRFGATDVMPFVPIRADDMPVCVEAAHALGARVGAELAIPVYFYEDAARRPGAAQPGRCAAWRVRGPARGDRPRSAAGARRGPRCRASAGRRRGDRRPSRRSSPTTSTSTRPTSSSPGASPARSASATAACPASKRWASPSTTACRSR